MESERVIGMPGGNEQVFAARQRAGLSMYGRCAGEVLWPVDAKWMDICVGIVRMTMGMRIVANEAKGEMPMCLPENAFMRHEG